MAAAPHPAMRRAPAHPRAARPRGAAAERPPRPAHHEGNEEQLPNHNSFANPSHHLSLFMQASRLAVRTGKLHLLASTLRPVSTSAAANSKKNTMTLLDQGAGGAGRGQPQTRIAGRKQNLRV